MAADPGEPVVKSFGDRLAERVAARRSQVVLGLDPDPARLWPEAVRRAESGGLAGASGGQADSAIHAPDAPDNPAVRAARAVAAHCALAIEATAGECVAVKLQVACFERLGAAGWSVLADTVALARDHGLLVIADAKRGDVDVTATAYAQAFLGETPSPFGAIAGLGADAMTVNPLLGRDSLAPFVTTARAHSRGLFVLVRTSNPGAADVQERVLADGGAVSEHIADLVAEIGAGGVGKHGAIGCRRGRRRHRPGTAGGVSGAHAARRVPASRSRGAGGRRRTARARVCSRAGGWVDRGFARDRGGTRTDRRGSGRRRHARGGSPARAGVAPGGVTRIDGDCVTRIDGSPGSPPPPPPRTRIRRPRPAP